MGHERLVDLGVSDLSTLQVRAHYLGGAASDNHGGYPGPSGAGSIDSFEIELT
jgi:hypothetical protein